METTNWEREDGGAVEGDFANTAAIAEELPRARLLPMTTRYRCFIDELAENQSLQRCRYGSSFVVHKRRRQEMSATSEMDDSAGDTVLSIPRRRTTPFDVAQRRLDTFHWLAQPRSTEDIQSRFALDRRTGAAPSLAALRRAVQWMRRVGDREDVTAQSRHGAHAAIVDLVEELVLEGSQHLSPALCLDMVAALADNPTPVARLLIARHANPPPSTAGSLLRTVWGPLCSSMASVALSDTAQSPPRVRPGFLEAFARVVQLTRGCGELTLVHAAAYGRCLLAGHEPTLRPRLVRLVRHDILNAPVLQHAGAEQGQEATPLIVGAFLSDVVRTLCAADDGAPLSPDGALASEGGAERVAMGCEVVNYAASRKIPLTSRSIETLIMAALDAACGPSKVLALFALMCVVSTPTLEALCLTLPHAFDATSGAPSSAALAVLPAGGPLEFYVWCVRRFAAHLFGVPRSDNERQRQIGVAAHLGELLCIPAPGADPTAAWWSRQLTSAAELVAALSQAAAGGPGDVAPAPFALLSAMMPVLLPTMRATPALAASPELQKLSAAAQYTLFGTVPIDGVFRAYWAAADGAQHETPAGLASLLQAGVQPECSCNVLDAAACNTLSAHRPHEDAFVKMMDGYARKKGALALLPFQSLASRGTLTDSARAMLRRWQHQHGDWFVCVPLSLSLTLGGHDDMFDASCELLRVIQQNGHKRAAIMTGDETLATQAKANGIQATIFLGALLTRLGA